MSIPETIALNVASSFIFGVLQKSAKVTGNALKAAFRDWLIDDQTAEALAQKLDEAGINDDMSPKAIEKAIASSDGILPLLQKIQKASGNTNNITQEHSGSGNNIGIQNNYR